MGINAIIIHPADNVAVAVREIKSGEQIIGINHNIQAREDIPRNHKVALREIRGGEKIIKYGETIGIASRDIQPGEWVHTHNLKAEDT